MAPREASVYFTMGKLYKKVGRLDDAMQHFCSALDLKPGAQDIALIKAAIDRLNIADDREVEDY